MNGSITRILIVEDERITAEDLRISLRNLGYEIVGAVATGEDAIATARKTQPDLVLMDIILKGKMNGIEATMRIQSELDIPVVYLTAFSDESTIMRLRESKPFGYLQKPFDDKELAGVIETALEKFRILKALRESREWFSITLQSIGDAVICTNMESRISFINPAAVKLTGWSEDKAMDRPLDEVFRVLNEENDQPIEDPAIQVIKQGHVKRLAERTLLIAKDGRRIPIDDSAAPIRNAQGETIGVVLVFKDVTERRTAETALRQSEEKYRILVDNANEAIFVAQDVRIRYTNPMTASMTGYTLEQLDSMDMSVLIHSEDRDRIMKHHDLKMRGKKTQGKDNCRIVTKTGEVRWAEFGNVRIEWRGKPATLNFLSDITERKLAELAGQKAEEALRKSEQHYRVLAEASPEMIFLLDLDGTVRYVNETAARSLGKSPDAVIGSHLHDLFPAEMVERHLRAIAQVIRTGETQCSELLETFPNGSRWIEARLAPVKNNQGLVTGVLGLSQDISDRKQAEEALQESQALYRSFVEQLPSAVFRKDGEDHYVMVNSQFCKLKGVKAEHFLGKKPSEVSRKALAKQGESGHAIKYAIQGEEVHELIMRTGKVVETEEEYPETDGGKRYMHATRMPVFNPEGKVVGTQGILFDITDRKWAEEALRLRTEELDEFFNVNLDLLCIADTDGRFLKLNPEWEKSLGFTHEELMSNRFLDFVHPDDLDRTLEAVSRLAKQEEVIDFINRYRCKDGSYRWLEWRSHPVGKKIYAAARDITDHMRNMESLRQSESTQRTFAEKLKTLMDTTNALSASPTFDDLCRNAVEFGREHFGFDRLGLWFIDEDRNHLFGSFGTDEKGRTRDERGSRVPISADNTEFIWRERHPLQLFENQELYDEANRVIGHGTMAIVNLWNGERVIGNLCADNLFNHRPFTEFDIKILNLYATVLGHLCTLKQTEEALRVSQQSLSNIAGSIDDVIYSINGQTGEFDYLSPSFERKFGYTESDIQRMGGRWPFLSQVVQNDQRPVLDPVVNEIQKEKIEETPVWEHWWRCKDGSLLFIEDRSVPIYDGGRLVRIDGLLRDITERKKAESQILHLNEVLKAIRDVNQLITHERDPRRLLQRTCDILQQTRNYKLAVIMTTEPGSDEIRPSAWAGMDLENQSFPSVRQNETAAGFGPSATAIRTGRTTLCRDAQRDPSTELWHDALRRHGIQSVLSVPIHQHGRAIGALSVASTSPEAFNKEEADLLEEMASDITFALESIELEMDRQLAEESLRRNEDRFRKLVESIIDYTYHVEVRDGVVISTLHGSGCTAVTGYTPDEYMTDPLLWLHMVLEPDKAAVVKQAESILAGKPVGPIEHRITHKDGTIRWIRNTPVPRYDADGRLMSYDGVILNVTEKKKADNALWESVEKINSIFRAAPTGIGVVVNRVITEANERLCEMTGYSREELLNQSTRIMYPTDEDFEYVGREKYRQIAEKGTGTVETHWRRKNGMVIDVLLSSTPINPSDLAHGVTFTALNITERILAEKSLRASERKFRTFIEQSVEGFGLVDEEGRIIEWNYSLAQITGLSRDEVLGLYYWDMQDRILPTELKTPERYEETKAFFQQILKTGRLPMDNPTQELVIRRSDGENRQVRHSAFTIKTEKGFRIGSITRDVTERKRADEALRSRNLELERFERLTVGRELKMAELKKEIASIKKRIEKKEKPKDKL